MRLLVKHPRRSQKISTVGVSVVAIVAVLLPTLLFSSYSCHSLQAGKEARLDKKMLVISDNNSFMIRFWELTLTLQDRVDGRKKCQKDSRSTLNQGRKTLRILFKRTLVC